MNFLLYVFYCGFFIREHGNNHCWHCLHSMYSVRPSVCRFAAVDPTDRRPRSIAAWPLLSGNMRRVNAGSATLSAYVGNWTLKFIIKIYFAYDYLTTTGKSHFCGYNHQQFFTSPYFNNMPFFCNPVSLSWLETWAELWWIACPWFTKQ